MSTAELVEQVKALPARERRRFVEMILALDEDSTPTPAPSERARRVFENKVVDDTNGNDRLARLRKARGIWKDRNDLPNLRELRAEWQRS
ncbi:MAG TPA: hypothetical protein VE863_12315 [Pyrinomonadaceae bacterium]|nr:hypothetical protein [Pyrinomonadaceae bacterium]